MHILEAATAANLACEQQTATRRDPPGGLKSAIIRLVTVLAIVGATVVSLDVAGRTAPLLSANAAIADHD